MKLKLYFKSACFIVIVVLLILSVRYVFEESSEHLQKVTILTNGELDYISKPQIIDLIKPFQQNTWWQLNVDDVTQALNKYPGIKEIKVQKRWPNQLVVELTEYKAKAYWNSQAKLLLEDGEVITPKYFAAVASLPIFYGILENVTIIKDGYVSLQKIALIHGFRIDEVSYQGNQWQITLNIKIKIWLGSKNAQNKLEQLLQNYKKIEIPQGQKLATVDMRYHSGFAVGFSPAEK